MNILFYRYGSICEPDIIDVLKEYGIHVIEESSEITRKSISGEERISRIAEPLLKNDIHYVFSINFFPYISDICEKLNKIYICLSVDCPVLELLSTSIRNQCNRIFLFDYTQYLRFQSENPERIFYLPLATNVARWDRVIGQTSSNQQHRYCSDISFVGSLYNEKNILGQLSLSPYTQGFVNGLANAQISFCGEYLPEKVLTDEIISEIKAKVPAYPIVPSPCGDADRYIIANTILGMHITEKERHNTLNTVARFFPVALYSRSDTASMDENIICRGGVSTLTEMPLVFRNSKINLNITMRPIQTGLSLRIWDVLGCGGFLLTNYQQELEEYFEIGTDLDCYYNLEDLIDKLDYYLVHDDVRAQIAINGYTKVKNMHTWQHRIAELLKIIVSNS